MNLLAQLLMFLALALGGTPAQRGPNSLTPDEVARLERLRGEFEHLPSAAKKKLLARAHALRERERQLERELTPEERVRLEDPARGRELWRHHVRERFQESGKKLYEELPAPLRKKLEAAAPEERRALVERLLADPEGAGSRVGRRLYERLGFSERDRRRFEAMPPLERLRRLHELEKAERHRRRRARD
ncbi:MAG: hypothetical protein ABL998_18795 [Planctomycetota bacterium]